jgi:hypothetical protein
MGVLRERDEVREGSTRHPRSAVARGWMRRPPVWIELLKAECRPKIGIGMFSSETTTGELAKA